MLKSIYDRAYKFIEDEVESIIKPYVEMYGDEFNRNPQRFFKDYLKFVSNLFEKNINIHVSYFHYFGSYMTQNLLSNTDIWVCFGAFEYELMNEELKKKACKFLKAISDGTRFRAYYSLNKN